MNSILLVCANCDSTFEKSLCEYNKYARKGRTEFFCCRKCSGEQFGNNRGSLNGSSESILCRKKRGKTNQPRNTHCSICGNKINQLHGANRSRCNSCNTKIRRIRQKQAAIDYLGGKCCKCDYDLHPSALEFHHLDPNEKDFVISRYINRKWEVIRAELDKCILLCSICHRIEHSKRGEQKWIDIATKYKGRKLE